MGRKARRRVEAPWHWDPCTLWGYWRQPRLPEVRYDEIARTACEGDIVLFTSSGVWAWMQDFWTDSTVSHVGMVVREPGSGRLCLAESTLPDERVADVRTNTVRDGPMIVPLAARIRTYIENFGYDVRYRALCPGARPPADVCAARRDLIWGMMQRKLDEGIGFDSDALTLMAANTGYLETAPTCWMWEDAVYDAADKEFCSSLVVECLQEMGVMESTRPHWSYAPRDFTDPPRQDLLLAPGMSYGPERRVVYYE
jgi:hypothetical protein